jgi:hypothetical protein
MTLPWQSVNRQTTNTTNKEYIMIDPATFVLVHGAWFGGWCWKKVTRLLRAAGHEVFAPTLTGLGERSHLVSPEVGQDARKNRLTGRKSRQETAERPPYHSP